MHQDQKRFVVLKKHSQLGLSLIELMIAISLSLLLMLGLYKVFDMQQHGFELISALNDMEDNAQQAIKVLSDDIRMADHWGGVPIQQISSLSPRLSASPGGCDETWVFDVFKSVQGIDGAGSTKQLKGLPSNCLKTKDYLSGSDLLALKFSDSRDFFYESEIDNKRYQKHYFLRSQSGKSALVFQGTQLAQAVAIIPDEGAHYNMLFRSSLYFLRPCSKKSDGCVDGESVLARLVLSGDRYIQEALVEGIEQMQFEYGVDENRDGVVENYLVAEHVVDWQRVLSIRIFLLVRSRLPDRAIDEKGLVYVMNSRGSETRDSYQVPDTVRYYPRKLYQREVALRNRLFN